MEGASNTDNRSRGRTAARVVGAIVLVLLAGLGLLLAHPDWLRRPAAYLASSILHRKVVLAGPLRIRWSATPAIQLNRLAVANASWDRSHPMIRIRRVDLSLALRPLLHGQVAMPVLSLEAPRILLERSAAGKANWVFRKTRPHRKKTRLPAIGRLRIRDGRLRFVEPASDIAANVRVRTRRRSPYTLVFSGTGRFRKAPFRFSGHGGSLLSLASHAPYPVAIHAVIGHSQGTARGTITDPQTLSGIHLTLSLAGSSMASLYPVFGIPLPKTAPYRLQGHITRTGQTWTLSHFTGHVGKSDLSGDLTVTLGTPLRVAGHLRSNRLDLVDLAGFTGAKPKLVRGKEKVKKTNAGAGKVLPNRHYKSSLLETADMDLTYRAKQFRSAHLPLDNLATHLRLRHGVLSFDPLDFGVADGTLASRVRVKAGMPLALSVKAVIRGVRVSKLLPKLKFPEANTGRLGGRIDIRSRGTSFAAFAAHANGHIGMAMAGGSISDLIVALAQMHLGNALADWLSGSRKEPVHCAVARFGIRNGVLKTRTLLVDTQSANLFGSGTVNFRTETLNIVLTTKPKHLAILSVRGPLYIRGTFKKPSVSVSGKKLIARGTAAGLLALANPAAALLALVDTAPGHHLDCPALLNKAGPKARIQALKSLQRSQAGH
ncbi:MAG: AsmA family protein [Acidiferrobacteraceae bacterium]